MESAIILLKLKIQLGNLEEELFQSRERKKDPVPSLWTEQMANKAKEAAS